MSRYLLRLASFFVARTNPTWSFYRCRKSLGFKHKDQVDGLSRALVRTAA